jgi:hypothetical protein
MEDYYLTIKELKEILKDCDDNGIIYYQRIEDVYFKKHNWKTKKMKDSLCKEIDDEYVEVFSGFKDKKGNIYLTAHY